MDSPSITGVQRKERALKLVIDLFWGSHSTCPNCTPLDRRSRYNVPVLVLQWSAGWWPIHPSSVIVCYAQGSILKHILWIGTTQTDMSTSLTHVSIVEWVPIGISTGERTIVNSAAQPQYQRSFAEFIPQPDSDKWTGSRIFHGWNTTIISSSSLSSSSPLRPKWNFGILI